METKTEKDLQDEIITDAFKKYEPLIRALCVQMLNDHLYLVDDCVSDTFSALCDAVKSGVKINHYQAWLYSTANNKIMDRYRELKRKGTAKLEIIAKETEIYNLSCNYDFDDQLFRDSDLEKVIIEIEQKLTDYEKRLFADFYKYKKPISQIAQEQNITESNVRKRKFRLKNKIYSLSKDALNNFYDNL